LQCRYKAEKNMKTFILFLIFNVALFSQNRELETYMSGATELYENSEYLFSAKLFKHIYENTSDSNLAAEALYKYILCGKAATNNLMRELYLLETLSNRLNEKKYASFLNLFKKQIQNFKEIGLKIDYGYFYEVYVDLDYSDYHEIFVTKFRNTKWAEKIAIDWLKRFEFSAQSLEPEEVISEALRFIKLFPNSTSISLAYMRIGNAYSDLWTGSQTGLLGEFPKEKAENFRIKCIEYYEKAIQLLKGDKKVELLNRVKLLKKKKYIDRYFYIVDGC